ncbi:MAG: type II toxin-antitoxin system VapC family toxin [Solirubrobacterales bacterium]
MIFVDSNIPMYIIGKDHPRKVDSQRLVERFASERRRLVTSGEVFQEILHRYIAADRRGEIELAFHTLGGIVDNVFSVREEDVFAAKDLTHAHQQLSARDALHAAVMRRNHIGEILSFDRGFDLLPWVVRIPGPVRPAPAG